MCVVWYVCVVWCVCVHVQSCWCDHCHRSPDENKVLPSNLKLLNLEVNKLSDWSEVLKLTYLVRYDCYNKSMMRAGECFAVFSICLPSLCIQCICRGHYPHMKEIIIFG